MIYKLPTRQIKETQTVASETIYTSVVDAETADEYLAASETLLDAVKAAQNDDEDVEVSEYRLVRTFKANITTTVVEK